MRLNRSKGLLPLFFASLALIVIGGAICGYQYRQRPAPARSLSVDRPSRRLAAAVGESSITTSYTIRNLGDRPVELGEPSTTCGCSVASIRPRRIAPGALAEIQVRGEPPRVGNKRVLIHVPTDAGGIPELTPELVMIGAGSTPYVAFDSRALAFGDLTADEIPARRDVMIMTRESVGTPPWIERLDPSIMGISIHGGIAEERDLGNNVLARTYRYVAVLDRFSAGDSIDGSLGALGRKGDLLLNIPIHGRLRSNVIAEPSALYYGAVGDEVMPVLRLELTSDDPRFNPERVALESCPPTVRVDLVSKAPGKACFEIGWGRSPHSVVRSILAFQTGLLGSPRVEVPLILRRTAAPPRSY